MFTKAVRTESTKAVRTDSAKLRRAADAVRARFPTAPAVPLSQIVGTALDLLARVYEGSMIAAPADQLAAESKEFARSSMENGFAALGLRVTVAVRGDEFTITRHSPVGTLPDGRDTQRNEIN